MPLADIAELLLIVREACDLVSCSLAIQASRSQAVSQPSWKLLEWESVSKDPGAVNTRKGDVVDKPDVDVEALKLEEAGGAGESGEPEVLPQDVVSS
jgi:hypothetical protein